MSINAITIGKIKDRIEITMLCDFKVSFDVNLKDKYVIIPPIREIIGSKEICSITDCGTSQDGPV